MADALAHGADVNWVNGGQENATPLIRATAAVRAMLTFLPHPKAPSYVMTPDSPWGPHSIGRDKQYILVAKSM
jgi:hypothetical protein